MSANPHANGGLLRKHLPDFRDYAVDVTARGTSVYENTRPLGEYLRDVMKNNPTTFRVFGPDETDSNRLQAPICHRMPTPCCQLQIIACAVRIT